MSAFNPTFEPSWRLPCPCSESLQHPGARLRQAVLYRKTTGSKFEHDIFTGLGVRQRLLGVHLRTHVHLHMCMHHYASSNYIFYGHIKIHVSSLPKNLKHQQSQLSWNETVLTYFPEELYFSRNWQEVQCKHNTPALGL